MTKIWHTDYNGRKEKNEIKEGDDDIMYMMTKNQLKLLLIILAILAALLSSYPR